MKKVFLLCALICVGQLYGMEVQPSYETLPQDLKQEIINTALATSKNVDEAINMIKRLGTLHGLHYDTQAATDILMKTLPNNLNQAINKVKNLQGSEQKDFTKLVHLLASKFNSSPYEVASLFNTPIAQKYLDLGKQWTGQLYWKDYKTIENLIAQGADVNFYNNTYLGTLLNEVIKSQRNIEIVKLLLAAGANPSLKGADSESVFDTILDDIAFYNDQKSQGYPGTEEEIMKLKTIKALLEEAMQKQQQ